MDKHNNIIEDELLMASVDNGPDGLQLDAKSIIMVIGVGGAGGNAVNRMQAIGITDVNFVVCNTDKQALKNCDVANKIQMGPGLGAGNNPDRGRELAIESEAQLRSLLETSNAQMVFIAAGMGGGTGTGASPVIAKMAHECGMLTVAVVTMPLRIEGKTRYDQAVRGVAELNEWVDSLLIIDNEKLCQVYGRMPITDAFGKADDILGMATKGIAELITVDSALVRVDFADVKTVMKGSGRAHMSVVTGSGENRALQIAEASLSSPLLDDNMITGAKSILLSFSVSDIRNLMMDEVTEAMDYIQRHSTYVDEDGNTHSADIIWGASEKSTLADDELELVVVATGFADGKDLKISTEYVRDPFGPVPTPEGQPINKPVGEPEPPVIKPPQPPVPETVTIMPSQDRYKQIVAQKSGPAYTRRKFAMYAGNESSSKTVYREAPVPAQAEVKPAQSNGVLFGEE